MLDEKAKDILRAKSIAHVALVDEKGRPHVSPVWVDVDPAGRLIINTAEGRVKARLLQVGTHVAISATHPDDPYRDTVVKGIVVQRTHEGAIEGINALSRKYRGRDFTELPDDQQRVHVLIEVRSSVS